MYRLARTNFLSQPVFIFNAKTFNKSVFFFNIIIDLFKFLSNRKANEFVASDDLMKNALKMINCTTSHIFELKHFLTENREMILNHQQCTWILDVLFMGFIQTDFNFERWFLFNC